MIETVVWFVALLIVVTVLMVVFALIFRAVRVRDVRGYSYASTSSNDGEIVVCGNCGARLYDTETVCRACKKKYTNDGGTNNG